MESSGVNLHVVKILARFGNSAVPGQYDADYHWSYSYGSKICLFYDGSGAICLIR